MHLGTTVALLSGLACASAEDTWIWMQYCFTNDCTSGCVGMDSSECLIQDPQDWSNINYGIDGNYCDTLDQWIYDNKHVTKILINSNQPWMIRFQLFEGDYCTGQTWRDWTPTDGFQDPGGNGWWFDTESETIKAVRVFFVDDYNTVDPQNGNDGIAMKVVYFPNTGMYPYREFNCQPWPWQSEADFDAETCTAMNNYCNQLDGTRLWDHPYGDCVSSDDKIWSVNPPMINGATRLMVLPTNHTSWILQGKPALLVTNTCAPSITIPLAAFFMVYGLALPADIIIRGWTAMEVFVTTVT